MSKKIFDLNRYKACARQCIAEGIVLLKNDNNVLPLASGTRIALFGRSQYNYYKSGTGSGGMVNTTYVTGIKEALLKDKRFPLCEELVQEYDAWIADHPFDAGQGWASEPWFQAEMPISEELAGKAAAASDIALVLIGRTAGEDQDNSNTAGSYLLTEEEEHMLGTVRKAFAKMVVLLNVGNIIDMKWVKKYGPDAVAYVWQGGQEGGNGVVDVLSGDVSPSGRLTDTIAENIEDYPSTQNFGGKQFNIQQEDIYVGYRYFETFAKDKVLYPFGFGLSYTKFKLNGRKLRYDPEEGAELEVRVENVGKTAAKEVIQLYLEAPQGQLGKPARVLVGFAKTETIAPGSSAYAAFAISNYAMASYDDSGAAGHKSAYVLEAGEYVLYVGENVRNAAPAGRFTVPETRVICQLSEAMAPVKEFTRMRPQPAAAPAPADALEGAAGQEHAAQHGRRKYEIAYENVPLATVSAQELRRQNLPEEIPYTGDQGWKLKDVVDGKCTMEQFIGQLSDEDLVCIVRGEGMSSPKVTPGCGGAIGGVTDSLLHFGIPVACVTDGPSGIRMDSGKTAFAMPNGTCLASTWNEKLMEELYVWEGLELRKNKIDVLLGPGLNLHRNPLNGRNFEYFSEDPLLTGRSAAAQLRGMHKNSITGTIKHFAMNTQETGRHTVEHIASERAIREIYLRGFELAVKEAGAHAVMTTYGPVNGFYTASSYDLVTRILREEWGFEGIVMTDWWAKGNDEGQPGDKGNMASMIRAQNDLYMVTGNAAENTNEDNSVQALQEGTVTRAEYQRSAANICRFITGKPVFARYTEVGNELDKALEGEMDNEERAFGQIVDCRTNGSNFCVVDPSLIDTARNATTILSISIRERGLYKLILELRAKEQGSLAQIPMTIFKDKDMLEMITLTGADNDWRTIELPLGLCFGNFFLKLYFAQAGMEIRQFRVEMTESKEEEIKLMLARMSEG